MALSGGRESLGLPAEDVPRRPHPALQPTAPWPSPSNLADTYFPSTWQYYPFLLACHAPVPTPDSDEDEDVIEVRIDVKPGDTLPTIQLGSAGVTTVAILGSASFDVSQIDAFTLYLAGTSVALDSSGFPWATTGDSNGDTFPDLIAKFPTPSLQLSTSDTHASVAGKTLAGRRFHGTDSVRVTQ